MFSRPSIRMRASDLYRGVTRLTAAIESTAASTVGTMIQPRLRMQRLPERAQIQIAGFEWRGDSRR